MIICSWKHLWWTTSHWFWLRSFKLASEPRWNIWNSTSPRFPEDCREHLGNLRSLEYHMMLAVWKLLLGSQQSVLEAGCALFTTSPSTELVFETDFFWFLQMFEVVYTRMWILKESQPCQSVQLSSSIGPYSCLVCKETQWGLHHIISSHEVQSF